MIILGPADTVTLVNLPYFFGIFMRALFTLVFLVFCGCSEQPETSSGINSNKSTDKRIEQIETSSATIPHQTIGHPETPTLASVQLSKNDATAMIFELPEIKAWSDYIESKTQGKAHGAIMTSSDETQDIDGKQYWSVDFYESQQTHMHRWESFLVRVDGKEILIDDLADGPISLQDWREQKKPLERIIL